MDVRKIIKEEIRRIILNEGYGLIPVPRTFDHLKWKLTPNQKHYLQRMCEAGDSIDESEYKDASRFLGIPEKNVKSIINTYKADDPIRESAYGRESSASAGSALTMGNKPATSKDIGLSIKDSRLPDFEHPTGKQMHSNGNGMTFNELTNDVYSELKNRVLYRAGSGKEHSSKSRERFFEGLNKSLMMYLYCESNPSDINLRHDDKIELEFEQVMEEGQFNRLDGGPNFENEKHKFIKELLESFNNKFGCSYVIYDHVKSNGKIKVFIEHNVTTQIDMSMDSVDMMKKFLLGQVITGHKIEHHNSHIASLMGLDAGDTTWLEGPIGAPMQSGILTRNR